MGSAAVIRLLAVTFVAGFALGTLANGASFDALTPGAYTSGTQFSNEGLQFTALGTVHIGTVSQFTTNKSFAGNYLNLGSNTGVSVNLSTGASEINFDYGHFYPGGTISLNGRSLGITSIPSTVGGAAVMQHLLGSSGSYNRWGNIRIVGDIQTFSIRGTELVVDNFNVKQSTWLTGDYDNNQIVNAADYVTWRKNIQTPSFYNSWRANFGATSPGNGSSLDSAAAVPEPLSLAIATLAGSLLAMLRHRNVASSKPPRSNTARMPNAERNHRPFRSR